MTIDPPPGFRDELLAALALLEPQINGLAVFITAPKISAGAKEILSGALAGLLRRRNLLQALIDALNNVVAIWTQLINDGYPALPDIFDAEAEIRTEIQETENSLVIAGSLFGAIAAPAQVQDTIEQIHTGLVSTQAAREALAQP